MSQLQRKSKRKIFWRKQEIHTKITCTATATHSPKKQGLCNYLIVSCNLVFTNISRLLVCVSPKFALFSNIVIIQAICGFSEIPIKVLLLIRRL
jgi:hypothetical protein